MADSKDTRPIGGQAGTEEVGCGCGCAGGAATQSTCSCDPETPEDSAADSDCSCGDCGGEHCMPAPTFTTFILSMASSAMVNLGEVPDPATGKQETSLVLAKHTIDIISMLQDKIMNGLDEEETRLLEGVLYELRMKFVLKK